MVDQSSIFHYAIVCINQVEGRDYIRKRNNKESIWMMNLEVVLKQIGFFDSD